MRKIHHVSGLILTVFVGLHLFNHSCGILGAEKHIQVMSMFRLFYRNIFAETLLFFVIAAQIHSGLTFFKNRRTEAKTFFEKMHIWSGLYLAFFFIFHVSAVIIGRLVLNLDTNYYFGVAGLNNFPTNIFFIPYYTLAIVSFFGHISAIHHLKMHQNLIGFTPTTQSRFILIFGIVLSIIILFSLTNRFQGVQIPIEYNVLIGK